MVKLLSATGTIITAPPNCEFAEVYSKVYLKISNDVLFPVRLGITDEQWSVRPYKNAHKLSYPTTNHPVYLGFFEFEENEWETDRTILLGEANLRLNGRKLEEPISV